MRSQRFDAIDALRGLALVWMTLFHFCFDLSQFGYWRQDLYNDPFWTVQRTAILGTFLFCAGMGQAVALHKGQSWNRFWRRWAQIAGCALLVTAGSWLMFPRSFIYFGVLHGIALMLVLVRLTARWGSGLWVMGLLAIAAAWVAPHLLAAASLEAIFNSPWLNWLGLITRKPMTEDYVPIFPWLGLMWWGVAAGNWLLQRPDLLAWQPGRSVAWLATPGRWSLTYYMLHQPVLIGSLMLFGWAAR
ncbi:MAG: DUF1624 domain-containing protein [Rhodoferax sp.]|nr:DUF1624 domain-containing protein [Rhodoferax sp.]